MKAGLVLALVPMLSLAAPTAKYVGGRYYLYQGEALVDGYYTQDYTAKAAAVNLSFVCKCPVTIKQPDIVVTTSFTAIALTWDTPTEREDGSPLPVEEIAMYQIEANGKLIEASGNSYIFIDTKEGENVFRIATVDSDGQVGSYSPAIRVTIP